MSRRLGIATTARLLPGIAAAALLLVTPLTGIAQQTEAELMQRLDSLRPLLDEAAATFEAQKAQAQESERLRAAAVSSVDTLQVGLITIVTPVEQAETARELFQEVWEEYYSQIDRSPTLEAVVFTFQWSDVRVPIHVVEQRRAIEMNTSWARRARVKDEIRSVIGTTINYDLRSLDTEVARWVSGNPLSGHDMEQVYRIVATTESRATRSCLGGETDACESALGLGTTREIERLALWYTPAERRSLVARSRFIAPRRAGRAQWERCVDDEVIEECDQLLGESGRGWTPLPGSVRATLLSYALRSGGEGAWGRLLENPDLDARDALAYASRMPLDELVAGWRAWLVENRPDTYRKLFPKSGLALAWTLLFAALAMRSTRWRLG